MPRAALRAARGLPCAASLVVALLAPAQAADLRIEVANVQAARGSLAIAVFPHPGAGFPMETDRALRRARVPVAERGHAETTISDLPAGDYAVALYHDIEERGRLETNLFGVPRQPYGFSNDPGHTRRAPSYDEARFTLPAAGATVLIRLR